MALQKQRLVRGIGIFGSIVIVLNGIFGAGIFALPSNILPMAGIWSPWLLIGVVILMVTLVLTFAELSSYFQESGGPVLYATQAFGPLTGFTTGWIYYLSRATGFAGNTHVLAIYLASLWPFIGTDVGRVILVVVVCTTLIFVNLLGVKNSVRLLFFFSFFKVIPLLVIILLGLQYVSPDVLFPESMPTVDDFGGAVLILLYALVGFETALITAGETTKPSKTLPKALIFTVTATGVLFFLVMLVYVSIFPEKSEDAPTLVGVGQTVAGPIGAIAIVLAAIFSIGGNISCHMLVSPRLTYSMAEQQLLPKWFSRVHKKYSSPTNSIIFFGVLCIILAASGSFVLLAVSTSLTRLISYIVSILALPVIKRKADKKTIENSFKLKGGYFIPALSLVLCIWAASNSSADAWYLVLGLLIFGLLLYALEKQLNKSKQNYDTQ
ncbi:APC family permease [Emcibacteraceae bacterium]|nr:APC family permease [Emcibacteraceae bacterium]MDA9180260.1 APC family permease [Emcibacteraceae bacterium]